MGRGKYSPNLPKNDDFGFNCYGQRPAPWNMELKAAGVEYDTKTMFDDYDKEGFDRYGYSSFDADGNYCFGNGVDRNGYTELDYLSMSDEEFDRIN
jgi:hypothetical protein